MLLKHWPAYLLFAIQWLAQELLKDRLVGWINDMIDRHAGSVLENLLEFVIQNPLLIPISIAAVTLISVILYNFLDIGSRQIFRWKITPTRYIVLIYLAGVLLTVLAIAISAFIRTPGEDPPPVPTIAANGEAGPATLQLSSTPVAKCVSRDEPLTPCWWQIEQSDSYTSIAEAVYKNRGFAVVLIHLNRDDEGYRSSLITGSVIFLPDKDIIPELEFATCVSLDNGFSEFPCQHPAQIGETYRSIAKKFYGSEYYRECILKANFSFDGVNLAALSTSVDEDVGEELIIVPVARDTCRPRSTPSP